MSTACVVLTGLVFSALVLRVLMVPGHFSVWAVGDAQMFAAGKHFANEGFLAHKLLPLTNPGSPHSFIANNGPTGHYSHYPALHAIVNGLFLMAAEAFKIVDDLTLKKALQLFYVAVSATGIFLLAMTVSRIYSRQIAYAFAALVAITPWVTGFSDSFCDQPLNMLLGGAFFYLATQEVDSEKPRLLSPALATTCFLLAQNTIEFIPVVATYYLAYGACTLATFSRQELGRLAAGCLGNVMIPTTASIGLHLYLSYIDFGSFETFYAHWHDVTYTRFATGGSSWILYSARYFEASLNYVNMAIVVTLCVFNANGLVSIASAERRRASFGLAFALALISHPLASPQQATQMSHYTGFYIYIPAILLSLVAIFSIGRRSSITLIQVMGFCCLSELAVTTLNQGVQLLVSPLSVANAHEPFWGQMGGPVLNELMKPEINLSIKRATRPQDILLFPLDAEPVTTEANPIWEFYTQRHSLVFHNAEQLRSICETVASDNHGEPATSPLYRPPRLLLMPKLTEKMRYPAIEGALREFDCKIHDIHPKNAT